MRVEVDHIVIVGIAVIVGNGNDILGAVSLNQDAIHLIAWST